jgi:hypothetical protein
MLLTNRGWIFNVVGFPAPISIYIKSLSSAGQIGNPINGYYDTDRHRVVDEVKKIGKELVSARSKRLSLEQV